MAASAASSLADAAHGESDRESNVCYCLQPHGHERDTHFFGHSLVIDPWGEIIAEAGEEETILYADIDLALVDAVRSKIPVFEDRGLLYMIA